LAISEFTESQRQDSPYPVKPHDNGGNPMPDGLWELVQCCFRYDPFERPTVDMIADTIAYTAGSTSSHNAQQSSTDTTVEFLNTQLSVPLLRASAKGKGKQPIRLEEHYGTVRLGPFQVVHNPEEKFSTLFKSLSQVVRKDVLVEPLLVQQDDDHLSLRFRNVLEANNFAMTWMVHRFDPYRQVTAAVVES
jgi:hypothetical protein